MNDMDDRLRDSLERRAEDVPPRREVPPGLGHGRDMRTPSDDEHVDDEERGHQPTVPIRSSNVDAVSSLVVAQFAASGGASVLASRLVSSLAPPS